MAAQTIRLAFIGAGFVNFGGGEGPWDHASRVERLPGVEVVGICDMQAARARQRLDERLLGANPAIYQHCQTFADWAEMLDQLSPDAVFIGLPPGAHGKTTGVGAVELGCASRGVHMFIEKPLSNGELAQVEQVAAALENARTADGNPLIVSVGYMLRYSTVVDHLRTVLATASADGRPPVVFNGRYCAAYSHIRSPQFWDRRTSGGPIIEQATHFVDLARYLLGEINLDSIQATVIPATDPILGALSDFPTDKEGRRLEDPVPPAYRNARATIATWRFTSGALGSLTHGLLQQGDAYDSELEVWADGLRAVLSDPYAVEPVLSIRDRDFRSQPAPICGYNDPYLAEDALFLQAIREGRPDYIRSPYADAVQTFAATVRITEAGLAGDEYA